MTKICPTTNPLVVLEFMTRPTPYEDLSVKKLPLVTETAAAVVPPLEELQLWGKGRGGVETACVERACG